LCHNGFFHLGLPFAEGPVEHFSLDRAGRHTIDADALSSKLQRSRLGKADDTELAGGINRRARKAEVACEGGVIDDGTPTGPKHVLIGKRPSHKTFGGLWEFPGGKIETHETPEGALIREINEELSINIKPYKACEPYPYSDGSLGILFHPIFASIKSGCSTNLEHDEILFTEIWELGHFAFAPPDLTALTILRTARL
jgi:8-oxo-dGTP diphosphatase